jgi:hypothetical protein
MMLETTGRRPEGLCTSDGEALLLEERSHKVAWEGIAHPEDFSVGLAILLLFSSPETDLVGEELDAGMLLGVEMD